MQIASHKVQTQSVAVGNSVKIFFFKNQKLNVVVKFDRQVQAFSATMMDLADLHIVKNGQISWF